MSIPRDVPGGASTTWEWRKVRMQAVPPGQGIASPEGTPSRFRVRRSKRRWTQIEVRYHGGPEDSWLLRSGGVYRRFPGWMALTDVLDFDTWDPRS